MRNKILIIIVIILSYFAVQKPVEKITQEENKNKNIEVRLLDKKTNNLTSLYLEDYIVGVVSAEMPASFSLEALKAQAVAARSFALYKINNSNNTYDLTMDTSTQAYITVDAMKDKWQDNFDKYYAKVKQAVEETKGQVMMYDDKIICAFYFAMSNGYTEDAALVFGNKEDYIVSVDSKWEENLNNFEVTTNISKNEFCQKLNISCNEINIGNINYSDTNRVNSIVINDKEFLGTKVRSLLGLRSTDFKIEVGEDVSITTKGYGHGVGMSQYGANELAKQGKNYKEILNYYYHNITIEKLNV